MIPVRRSQVGLPNVWFNDFLNDDAFVNLFGSRKIASPAVNIVEIENGFRVEIAAPGLAKEDFKVDVNKDNQLLISAEKKIEEAENGEKKERYLRKDFEQLQFRQALALPEDVDKDAIIASYENGVLSIEIPKRVKEEVAESKSIAIS